LLAANAELLKITNKRKIFQALRCCRYFTFLFRDLKSLLPL
jgi:hypothetical protein